MCYVIGITVGDEMYEYMDIHLDLLIPLSIKKHSTPEQLSGLVQKLRQYYFNGGPVNKTSIKGYVDVSINPCLLYTSRCV